MALGRGCSAASRQTGTVLAGDRPETAAAALRRAQVTGPAAPPRAGRPRRALAPTPAPSSPGDCCGGLMRGGRRAALSPPTPSGFGLAGDIRAPLGGSGVAGAAEAGPLKRAVRAAQVRPRLRFPTGKMRGGGEEAPGAAGRGRQVRAPLVRRRAGGGDPAPAGAWGGGAPPPAGGGGGLARRARAGAAGCGLPPGSVPGRGRAAAAAPHSGSLPSPPPSPLSPASTRPLSVQPQPRGPGGSGGSLGAGRGLLVRHPLFHPSPGAGLMGFPSSDRCRGGDAASSPAAAPGAGRR